MDVGFERLFALLADEFGDAVDFFVGHEPALSANESRGAGWTVEQITLSEEAFGAVFIEDDAAIERTGDLECDTARDIGLDHAGDHVGTWGLRGDDHVN